MIAILGMISILFFAWLLSVNRKNIPYRTVILALGLQIIFALLVLYVPAGKAVL